MLAAKLRRWAAARPHSSRAAVRTLAASRLISLAGTDATGVAIGFALYAQTHSASWLSTSLLVNMGATALLAPLGGKAGDLFDRRRLMIAAELCSAAVFVTLALIHTPAALLSLGVLAAGIGTVFGPAAGAAIAHIAGDEDLAWANGAVATGGGVGKTAGRLGGGLLIALLGAGGVFLADAVTFLLSAWMITSVKRAFSGPLTDDQRPAHPAVDEPRTGGLRMLRREPMLRALVAAACVSTFATGFSMTAEVPLVFQVGAGAIGLGGLTACWGVGMALGSWYAGRVLHSGNEPTGLLAGRLAMAIGVGLVAAMPSIAPMLACYLVGGLGGGFMGVAAQSILMRRVPSHLYASVIGTLEGCRNVAFCLGAVGAGAIVSLAGPRSVYALVGLTMALGTLPLAMLTLRQRLPAPPWGAAVADDPA